MDASVHGHRETRPSPLVEVQLALGPEDERSILSAGRNGFLTLGPSLGPKNEIRGGGYQVMDVPLDKLRDWCLLAIEMIDSAQEAE